MILLTAVHFNEHDDDDKFVHCYWNFEFSDLRYNWFHNFKKFADKIGETLQKSELFWRNVLVDRLSYLTEAVTYV